MKTIPCPEHGDKVIAQDIGEGTVYIPVQGETPDLVNYMLVWWDVNVVFEAGRHLHFAVYWDTVIQVWRRWEDTDEALSRKRG